MAITDLIPWKKKSAEQETEERAIQVQQQDPFLSFQQQINQMFDDFFRGWGLEPFGLDREKWELFSPSLDVVETDKEIKVSVELPGMDEKDIDVKVFRDMLTISGEKRQEKEERGHNYLRTERSYGAFQRTVPLPSEVDVNKADAVFRKGVLTVTLPKATTAQTRKIAVKKR
ncbi:MAG TPA: Hsp20/alpha crystallin family protein [Anaerolineae bacterium]|nr:Hsp20/alpha crystallin family protein [Anaerolineae bacterium]